MTITECYTPTSLLSHLSWPHFFYAWGFKGKDATVEAARSLQREAIATLHELEAKGLVAKAKVVVLGAVSRGDDIIVEIGKGKVRIPCLRQQMIHEDSDVCRCLSDYVAPGEFCHPIGNRIGVFATSVNVSDFLSGADDYRRMLLQTLADRLAEAAAEEIHVSVYRQVWARQADAPIEGIRPAVGYPSLPDMSLTFVLDDLLDFSDVGV